MDRDKISNLYRGPSIDATYQISVHLTKRFQRRRFFRNQPIKNKNGLWRPCLLTDRDDFKNRPIINKNCLWWPCLLMDQDKMNNLYRGPSIDATYQIPVHLGKQFQRRRFFRNQPIKNKNCLWRPCLLMDRDKMSNLYSGPSIDASY
jgi:hypothetical protein